MRLVEIQNNGYAALESLAPEKKIEQIEAIRYVERLATQTSTNIETWDITEIFGLEGNAIHVERGEINQRFFKKKAELKKKEKPIKEVSLPAKTIEKLHLARDKIVNNSMRKLIDQVAAHRKQATAYAQGMETEISNMTRLQAQIELGKGSVTDLVKEVQAVAQGPFWKLWDVMDTRVEFATTNDIVLTHKNTKAKQDLHINLGKFLAVFELEKAQILIQPHHNNRRAQDRYHPHMFDGGRICWGAASTAMAEYMSRGQLFKLFELLSTILINHNPDDPAYELGRFKDVPVFNPTEPMTTEELVKMPMFKVGDQIRCVSRRASVTDHDGCTVDKIYEVSCVQDGTGLSGRDQKTTWAFKRLHTPTGYWLDPVDFRIVEEPAKPKTSKKTSTKKDPK